MTNCPKCGKPILNEGVFTSAARFNMRCPWCQATLEINVKPKIITEVIKLANGDPYRPNQVPAQSSAGSNQRPSETGSIETQEKPRFKLVGYLYQDQDQEDGGNPGKSLDKT